MRWELPVLALRNLVIVPGTTVSVSVGRMKSRRAIEEAQAADRRVLILTQRDQSVDEPAGEDLFENGTLASIKQVVRLQDGTLEVLVESLERAKVVDYLPVQYLRAVVETISDDTSGDARVIQVLASEVKDGFEKYVAQNKNLRMDNIQLEYVRNLSTPGALADQVTSHSTWEVADKQIIVEAISIRERLEKVLQNLNRDLENFEMDKKIAARVKEQMDQNQREYYLREQMKAIGKELGGGEDGPAEVEELREKIMAVGMPEKVQEKALKELARLERTRWQPRRNRRSQLFGLADRNAVDQTRRRDPGH